MGWSNPVVSIAETAALGLAIAEAIEQTGVSLLGAPTLLYNAPVVPLNGAGPVGATVDPQGYGLPENDFLAAAQEFDGYLNGLTLGVTMRKWYLDYEQYYLTSSAVPSYLIQLAQAGCQILLSVKPNTTNNATDYANVTTTIRSLQAAGVTVYGVILWQEPNTNASNFPGGAAGYVAYAQYYAGAIRAAGLPHYYDPDVSDTNDNTYQTFYPGDNYVDGVVIDYYGAAYKAGARLDQPAPGATISPMGLADNNINGPVPFGIGEWGNSATGNPIPQATWDSYYNYVLNLFATRLDNGQTNGPVCWYSGKNASGPNILPSGAGYDLTAGIEAVYTALSPASQQVTIAAGQTLTLNPITPSPGAGYALADGISYEITLGLTAASGSTNPWDTIRLEWFNQDVSNAPPINPVKWSVPAGQAGTGGTVISGNGPQLGQYAQVQVTNHDTVAHTLTLQLTSTSRTVQRDVWWWQATGSGAITGYTLPGGTSYANSLGSINGVSIPANGSKSWLMSMFSGQVSLEFSAPTGSPLQFLLQPQPASVFGIGAIYDMTTTTDVRQIILPRAPCVLQVVNPNSSAADAYAEIIALD